MPQKEEKRMGPVKAVLVGAGARGMDVYAAYALAHKTELQFVAVAEPDEEKRRRFCALHGIPPERAYKDDEALFAAGKLGDCAFVCTQDRLHTRPAMMALEQGYDVLLEKPMATTREECELLVRTAQRQGRKLMLCHVLRYTRFFSKIKELLEKGAIGTLVGIAHNEDIGYWHFAHSYVRGEWRRADKASPMILAKCCHDLDILRWLAGSRCTSVYSTGDLYHFKAENAPEGAPARCLDGCAHLRECPSYAPAQYLTEDTDWPTAVISADRSIEARTRALEKGPYGRCVYRCDNDVCDRQSVVLQFENGVHATFTASAFSENMDRRIVLDGTGGRITGSLETNTIALVQFATGLHETFTLSSQVDTLGHGGGDQHLIADFVDLVRNGSAQAKTMAQDSLESHMLAFAAEESRLAGRPVAMPKAD